MTRPGQRWHPFLQFWSTWCHLTWLASHVTPKKHLEWLVLPSQSATKTGCMKHSFLIHCSGKSGQVGKSASRPGTSDLKICNRCKGILFLKFLLSLFLWDAARFFVVNLLKEARAWKPGEQSSSPVSINVSGFCVKKTLRFVFHLNDIIQLELTRNRKESRTTQEN